MHPVYHAKITVSAKNFPRWMTKFRMPVDSLFRRFRRLLAMNIRTQCHGGVHFGQCHGGGLRRATPPLLSQDFLGTLKSFGACLISKAIGFLGTLQSFGAYIISQAKDFLDTLQSFEAYLRSKAAGFPRYVAKL